MVGSRVGGTSKKGIKVSQDHPVTQECRLRLFERICQLAQDAQPLLANLAFYPNDCVVLRHKRGRLGVQGLTGCRAVVYHELHRPRCSTLNRNH